MSNLRDRRPRIEGGAHRDLLTASLRTFDAVFDEWTETRGLGQRGNIRGSHARNPHFENELVLASMGRYPATILQNPDCYNEACDFTCPNNRRIFDKLRDVAERYCRVENPWQTDFDTRIRLSSEVVILASNFVEKTFYY